MRPIELLASATILAMSAAPAVQAQSAPPTIDRMVPTDARTMKSSFAPVVRRAAPAVVNVLTIQQQRDPWFELFGIRSRSPAQQAQGDFQPTGSGVIVRSDGVVVTNNHVVQNATRVRVTLQDRREFDARVLLKDPRADLAVLKIDATGLPAVNIDTAEQHEVGDLVLAIGNPFGVGQTVTNGIISATHRTTGAGDFTSFIQTDAAINPGNSGGALVDMDGDLIGINSQILSRSGTSTGVGFAVPAVLVRQVVDTAVSGGTRVVRPYLGVGATAVTQEVAGSFGLSQPQGVLVGRVAPGSPAARAGLREGDLITAYNGVAVNDPDELTFQIGTGRPGQTVPLQLRRGSGRTETLNVRLEAPPVIPAAQRILVGEHPLSGALMANLSTDVLERLGENPLREGVVVLNPGRSYAARIFRTADVITAVNGQTVGTIDQLERALASARSWRIQGIRSGQAFAIDLGV